MIARTTANIGFAKVGQYNIAESAVEYDSASVYWPLIKMPL